MNLKQYWKKNLLIRKNQQQQQPCSIEPIVEKFQFNKKEEYRGRKPFQFLD